ncbi:grasp-with-spasm system ATP-grasp peptide maturase [Chryseobacterium sp. PBS4-4]|uniref:Grasp-with-spasm system ATP-grasp peptide maturase n=1 Tax=Chryseobacterium edaphi TaxID=2976532 RepID=A0ABT2W8I5_9FLAO|nr:grasp-with-spasm system ATP-grasp peptide maturase [Chryseobacterium edaphi]MCU7618504.1 grasp-with-spasm system ATP-grasp peptide maturase [Chryseobacterium edaphi]
MVLILSLKNDFTTNLVIDWLCFYAKKHIRINDSFTDVAFKSQKNYLKITNDSFLDIDHISSFWFRKGTPFINTEDSEIIKDENKINQDYLSFLLQQKKSIGNTGGASKINKLIALNIAASFDLRIPKTFLVDNKNDLADLVINNSGKRYIIKAKTNISMYQFDDSSGMIFTNEVKKDDLEKFPEKFGFTLVQELIVKKFEIRTFFLKNKTWSMAIFSQNDSQTENDYRRYNNDKPNRNTLFQLPTDIEEKLRLVMSKLNLDTGSIDWIYADDNQFYFLEINPIGQFTNLSFTCNYNLEKEVAKLL